MFKAITRYFDNMSKTIIYDTNKIKIGAKPFIGEQVVFYNNVPVETNGFFGGVTSAFIAIENERQVQYNITICLRWHCCGFYTVVKRQGQTLYSDK
ncbi:MAG: hypothetical protein H0W73_00890 [Bacteroidetes bacterium]|nr:hypothetical protein [Bacteroidota bacterium]